MKSVARGDLWLLQLDAKEDPVADRHTSFHPSHSRFTHVPTSKSFEELSRLRKLTSLSYLSGKLRGMFHREHRDTIVCEEDEEIPGSSKRNIYDIIRRNEGSSSTRFDHLAKFSDCMPAMRPVALSQSASMPESHEPSKEQRWCTNCSKCFQRGLSRFDQYCGLDCKTAHRMRQVA
ncbi:uncharacterized protein PITG_09283 [Phytophthora infestans T30-4]|uniref:Uncharacterized protein n=2 Tax=Phytophthora infestans TaxID=4787 RepID=D0NBB5_PHYIT|nr:uncharacterized protein PITG_09283 [Phytophthora infestans T30-4]EEY55344.1 conserved hypothetical protein [Phytophthora infestans T30-4]KAF4034646.1 hypothetical protein GN244_ATG13389 [Phytophthora infestans]|eukprot:XP_002903568.1 conserved hypothetical protein [Phytophthora infestans T30-4]